MLSRLALRNAQLVPTAIRGVKGTSSSSSSDLPRPKRLDLPSPVRHGFIPEEWFTFFYNKTGVSGPYVFLGTLGTFLVSKEYYVLEHEFYNGLSFILIWIVLVKKFGPSVAQYLDKKVNEVEDTLNANREEEKKLYQDAIKSLETEKWRLDAQTLIFEAKKQNIAMQLEAIYRERMAEAYSEVKKRLDYHAQIDTVQRRISQKNMVQYIVGNVLKAITPDQEKANLQQCIKDLEALAVKV